MSVEANTIHHDGAIDLADVLNYATITGAVTGLTESEIRNPIRMNVEQIHLLKKTIQHGIELLQTDADHDFIQVAKIDT